MNVILRLATKFLTTISGYIRTPRAIILKVTANFEVLALSILSSDYFSVCLCVRAMSVYINKSKWLFTVNCK